MRKNETISKGLRKILRMLGLNRGKRERNTILKGVLTVFSKMSADLKLFKIMAFTLLLKCLSDLGLNKGCLWLALKCCSGQNENWNDVSEKVRPALLLQGSLKLVKRNNRLTSQTMPLSLEQKKSRLTRTNQNS